ncbi:MAG: YicC family protein [Odoribacteraceae bacterium]|nr:YicC family protein [Odoribacteraceae bacterium]
MIKSMTGFGRFTARHEGRKIVIEIRSLNSKQMDINARIPALYKEKEIEIRKMIKERLDRGKAEIGIYIENETEDEGVSFNRELVALHYRQAREIADALGVTVDGSDLFLAITRLPDALREKSEELSAAEWECLKGGVEAALDELNRFREQEGNTLLKDLLYRLSLIEEFASAIPRFEEHRVKMVKQRLLEKMREWIDMKTIDRNRLEQELIYYLEKIDITEEKTRLAQHCRYFVETTRDEEAPGRKLGFIAQEIGREINTIGSKANDVDIQKLVVQMKDELEKIKEQTLNLL